MRISDALQSLRPDAQWSMDNGEYSTLKWLDESQTKPTEDAVNTKLTELTNEYHDNN